MIQKFLNNHCRVMTTKCTQQISPEHSSASKQFYRTVDVTIVKFEELCSEGGLPLRQVSMFIRLRQFFCWKNNALLFVKH